MTNRTIAPQLVAIDKIDFIRPEEFQVNDIVPLFQMKNVKNETVRLELYFDAGSGKKPGGIPAFVNGLLLSGTKDHSSQEIEATINGLGGFYDASISMENAVITTHCLKENLIEIASAMINAIRHVEFFQSEVDEFLADSLQRLKINMEKVSFQSRRMFKEKLFSNDPNYSANLSEEDYKKVTIAELKAFHAKSYINGLNRVGLVGNIEDDMVSTLITLCKPLASTHRSEYPVNFVNAKGEFHHEVKDAMQSAVRVGRILFNRNHPDYLDFLVLHTILGDYFGSRLMSNIREDKGYTYGIGSALPELNGTGYFLIATEVRKDVREATLKEIQREIKRLQEELVPLEELEVVKNYMLGQLLKSADGPYAMMDLFQSADLHGKSLNMYNEAIKHINAIQPQRIQELARLYLNWEEMSVVTCG